MFLSTASHSGKTNLTLSNYSKVKALTVDYIVNMKIIYTYQYQTH